MTSREIIISLIDQKVINGEQAFILINDIIAAELLEGIKILKESDKKDTIVWNNGWTTIPTYTSTISCTSGTSSSSI